ncbi:M16 family metallopeptidase [Maribacter litoralis]|uniref:Predicted Zn-dependent peptidase n=1 Tax=Maribacter litoralis TaxID=2059726 RepID=A0A653PYT2_9FLAO|nr:pitrilysin family protein [Maribacter litoralis]VXB35197.1 Predicted Zn-dependent peptidase [Maribacter litoralis]
MKMKLLLVSAMLLQGFAGNAQEVAFEEYDLDNDLHVILHQDNTAPIISISVLYHVGSKDEDPKRTGFAHFFEHLLFEGTENIEKGEWDKIVSSNGGSGNATTDEDRTYYYEVFPSNNLELGLWLESERMLHPVINQKGVDTQNEVVKEEKRLRVDNSPYGKFIENIKKNLFQNHPYKETVIGKMEDLDAATLDEFIAFQKKFYSPNNAVLVIAGDFEKENAKKLISDYFEDIPKGKEITRNFPIEEPITTEINAKAYDSNIQIPASMIAYRTPGLKNRDSQVLKMISTYLSDGPSSKLYKKMVDDKKQALQIGAIPVTLEDYGMYIIFALPVGETGLSTLNISIEEEVTKLRNELISENDYQKLQNKFENQFVNSNSSIEGIANSLAEYYMQYDDTSLINKEIEIYRSITREEIKEVANKYLKPNQRLVLEYLPEQNTAN